MEKRALFICNIPYQLLVACWIQYHYRHDPADVVLTDQMVGYQELQKNLAKGTLFENVYSARVKEYNGYHENMTYSNKRVAYIFPQLELNELIKLNNAYTEIYTANINRFSCLIYNTLCHKQRMAPVFNLFEDGLSTCSTFFEYVINKCKEEDVRTLKHRIGKLLYREKRIYGNIEKVMVFNPQFLKWHPSSVFKLDPIDVDDDAFLTIINQAFNYRKESKLFKEKIIFMEESYPAEGVNINDLDLVNQIANKVGKENIIVKRHPRNQTNRFKDAGYKTIGSSEIPWEVIVMNHKDVSDKIFITILSGSITNPILLFDMKLKVYSLYYLIEWPEEIKKKPMFKDVQELMLEVYESYPKLITMCKTIHDIKL